MANLARGLWIWGPPLALMMVIFAFSAMPSDDPDHGLLVLILRKVAHFSEYAALLALWWRALATRIDSRRAVAAAFAICVAYASTDELHQTFVDGRVGTPRAVLIDAAGAAVAAAAILFARQRRKQLETA